MTNVHFLGNIRRRKVYDDSESLRNRRRANSVHKNIVNNIGGKGRTQKYVYETRTSNFHLRQKNAYLGLSISLGVCYLIDVCRRNTEYVRNKWSAVIENGHHLSHRYFYLFDQWVVFHTFNDSFCYFARRFIYSFWLERLMWIREQK